MQNLFARHAHEGRVRAQRSNGDIDGSDGDGVDKKNDDDVVGDADVGGDGDGGGDGNEQTDTNQLLLVWRA